MEKIIAKEIEGKISLMQPQFEENKLAKARKMPKLPGSLGLKKFVPGKIWVENVLTQNTCIHALTQNNRCRPQRLAIKVQ